MNDYKFTVDGVEYDINSVPDKALAILKEQAVNCILSVNQSKKKLNKLNVISNSLVFVGFLGSLINTRLTGSVNLILGMASIACSICGVIGNLKYYRNYNKTDPQLRVFNNINAFLTEEIEKREKFNEIFPEFQNKNLSKPVQCVVLDGDFEY